MKILELSLTNFLPILSGTGKEHIHIDLRNTDELINIFIGKIGSGKTYILSHLQPFATVGTLDVRNSDDPIVPEKDGKKVIVYEKNNHEYVITHDYIWSGKSHTKKSYIEKDGVELNENGNSSSFKEIIQIEFGIDQSFLRLIRLGPNVINFIHMKATERKSYVASLLQDTELYLLLYKNWSNDLRTLNTKATILLNKLNSFGKKSVEEMKEDMDLLEEQISALKNSIEDKTKEKYTLQAENKSLIGDMDYKEMKEYEAKLESMITMKKTSIQQLNDLLNSFSSYPEITKVSKEIGRLDNVLDSLNEKRHQLEEEYQEVCTSLNTLYDKKAMHNHEDHMKTLQDTYNQLLEQDKNYKNQLHGFDCVYSSTFLTGFLEDLNGMNVLINDITQHDQDMIRTLYNSDASVISYAKKQEEILGYRKLKVQKMINNLKFSDTYEASSKLYFPPMCPTKSCPYYQTHPATIQKKNSGKNEIQEQVQVFQNEIQEIDIELAKYGEYPILYNKISTLKSYWKKAYPVLKNINAFNCDNLLQILTLFQYRVWYNYDKIIDTIDLIEKREKYYELTEKIKTIKNEINELSILDSTSIKEEISKLEERKHTLSQSIEATDNEISESTKELTSYNQMYVDLSEKSVHESMLQKESKDLETLSEKLITIQNNDDKIKMNLDLISNLDRHVYEESDKMKKMIEEVDLVKAKLNDIKYTNKELDQVLVEQNYMTAMVDAVSSKKGIPLVMIQLFLDSCRDIVNELISNICEDDIEILPFKINETEFKIPYMINGQKIDDISKASQGQTSIVSTAISFALVRQTGSTQYNIPLLDEMDGPLHKSDKQRFISILLKHLKTIGSEQCFVITHDDNTFDGYPVQVIMTTDEKVNKDKYRNIIKI